MAPKGERKRALQAEWNRLAPYAQASGIPGVRQIAIGRAEALADRESKVAELQRRLRAALGEARYAEIMGGTPLPSEAPGVAEAPSPPHDAGAHVPAPTDEGRPAQATRARLLPRHAPPRLTGPTRNFTVTLDTPSGLVEHRSMASHWTMAVDLMLRAVRRGELALEPSWDVGAIKVEER